MVLVLFMFACLSEMGCFCVFIKLGLDGLGIACLYSEPRAHAVPIISTQSTPTTHIMKTKLILDASNCPTNSFSVIITNARWIAEAKTWKSGSSRARVVRAYLLNAGLPSAIAWQLIDQLDTAINLTEQGIAL